MTKPRQVAKQDPVFFSANPPPVPGAITSGGRGSTQAYDTPNLARVHWRVPPAHWSDKAYLLWYQRIGIDPPPRVLPQAFPRVTSAPPAVPVPEHAEPPDRPE